ncbi:hypothetical protein Dsin_000388 [Dipteronia sinensis]|uniref:Uncharacterized protein n=1 Tax=Dipteronia sinensis TaxID=43782 RepID=A0AAE0B353_9ROSI|nr:hypothetical protein Dsin_000388 [Dipteronia sinensis]
MERNKHTEMTTKNPYWNTRFLRFMLNLFGRNINKTVFRCIWWIKYNICFCKAAPFASGLVFSYKLAEKAIVSVFITYFTQDASESDLRVAIAFVNGQEALSALLYIFMIYLSQAFSGHLKRIIFCLIVAYTCGMVILSLLLLDELDRLPFDPTILSFIGLILVAVGRAGLMPFVRRFTAEQFEAHETDKQNIKEERVKAREEMWWRFAWVIGSLVSIPLFNSSWDKRLITAGWVMGITFVLFYLATPLYHKREAAATTTIAEKPFICIRVVRAALLKRHMEYSSSPAHFFHYNNINDELELWPQVKLLRWIDKAAIIEFESSLGHEEQEKAGRLCSVTMVQETKYILKLIPMWSTFLVFGLLLSAGNTFSAQQGIQTESPDFLIYLVLLQSITRETGSTLSRFLLSNMMRIWAGMLLSILCSAVLWRVEDHRLDISKSEYGFYGSMSIWWLAPQFLLLGLMDGLAMYGLEDFTIDDDHLSGSMKNFLPAINTFIVTGIGSTLNIIFVFCSNNTLFHERLNDSRLDRYYKYLTIYGTPINCVYLLLISIFVYGLSDAAQINEESKSKTTGLDAYASQRVTCGDIFCL